MTVVWLKARSHSRSPARQNGRSAGAQSQFPIFNAIGSDHPQYENTGGPAVAVHLFRKVNRALSASGPGNRMAIANAGGRMRARFPGIQAFNELDGCSRSPDVGPAIMTFDVSRTDSATGLAINFMRSARFSGAGSAIRWLERWDANH